MNDIIFFIVYPEFTGILFYARIVFIAVSFLLGIWIIFLLLKSSWLKYRFLEDMAELSTHKIFGAKKTFKKWRKIARRVDSGKEAEYKLALIEADGFLDDILKKMGYEGESMGDRLKQIDEKIIPWIDEIWEVHKIRNNIVHDPSYKLTESLAKKALEAYEKILQELEVL